MATYIALIGYTDQGIRNIKESPQRAAHFEEAAKNAGVTVKQIYWTAGTYDGALVLEAPSEEAVTKLMLSLGLHGNVRTNTLRAYDRSEMASILADVR